MKSLKLITLSIILLLIYKINALNFISFNIETHTDYNDAADIINQFDIICLIGEFDPQSVADQLQNQSYSYFYPTISDVYEYQYDYHSKIIDGVNYGMQYKKSTENRYFTHPYLSKEGMIVFYNFDKININFHRKYVFIDQYRVGNIYYKIVSSPYIIGFRENGVDRDYQLHLINNRENIFDSDFNHIGYSLPCMKKSYLMAILLNKYRNFDIDIYKDLISEHPEAMRSYYLYVGSSNYKTEECYFFPQDTLQFYTTDTMRANFPLNFAFTNKYKNETIDFLGVDKLLYAELDIMDMAIAEYDHPSEHLPIVFSNEGFVGIERSFYKDGKYLKFDSLASHKMINSFVILFVILLYFL